MKKNGSWESKLDPFGDFTIIFEAANNNIKILNYPVRYYARKSGAPNISRWIDGIKLLNRGKKNKAMSKFLFSMELNPTLVENYIALSDMSYDRGDMDKTMQYLDKGFSINPTNQNLIFRKSKYARE